MPLLPPIPFTILHSAYPIKYTHNTIPFFSLFYITPVHPLLNCKTNNSYLKHYLLSQSCGIDKTLLQVNYQISCATLPYGYHTDFWYLSFKKQQQNTYLYYSYYGQPPLFIPPFFSNSTDPPPPLIFFHPNPSTASIRWKKKRQCFRKRKEAKKFFTFPCFSFLPKFIYIYKKKNPRDFLNPFVLRWL